jgi:hypothetical protein
MPDASFATQSPGAPAQRLERGEVLEYPVAPFPLPTGDDLRFLLGRELSGAGHKNISYTPRTGATRGYRGTGPEDADNLRRVLADFADSVAKWLAGVFPRYAAAGLPDQVTYRPQEEAGRGLRRTARNDLLHVDAFPSRPTRGWRILRVFANVNPVEPRVWVTSDPFAVLLQRYGERVGLPGSKPLVSSWRRLLELFRPGRSEYDSFMLRFHDYLKGDDEFQSRTPKTKWSFAPRSAWVAMTDACSHSVLSGRYALEHSFFVPPQALALPDESPAALLARAVGRPVLSAAG